MTISREFRVRLFLTAVIVFFAILLIIASWWVGEAAIREPGLFGKVAGITVCSTFLLTAITIIFAFLTWNAKGKPLFAFGLWALFFAGIGVLIILSESLFVICWFLVIPMAVIGLLALWISSHRE